jgi:hypothetical protein
MKLATIRAIDGMLPFFLLLAACGAVGEAQQTARDQPLDGGYPLKRARGAEADKVRADDPCWRKEKGGWHLSTGHCSEMLAARAMTGVFVTGFEEESFFPDATAIPGPNDNRRYRLQLELDQARLTALAGRTLNGPPYKAYRLKFTGRRTRYPVFILCNGDRGYVFIADRTDEAEYLGAMPDPDPSPAPPDRPFNPTRENAKIAHMEDQALANCFGR